MTERPDGFYWVRRREWSDLVVGRMTSFGSWYLPGDSRTYLSSELHEIGERVERREPSAQEKILGVTAAEGARKRYCQSHDRSDR